MLLESSRRFTFGHNWQKYLRAYTPERQQISKNALLGFLQAKDLNDRTFLDIGSGSGINSAAAWLAGARHVHSFDYDPNSVAATRQLHAHYGSPENWTIEHGSVLDADFMRGLGTFDIVYAWGVLHHTGSQWEAIRNTAGRMHDRSVMYIALYAKEARIDWQSWSAIKQRYNKAGWALKRWMEIVYIRDACLNNSWRNIYKLPGIARQYQKTRGMDLMTDVRDWLGGWPTEFSSVHEVVDFGAKELGLTLVNLQTGEGNSEFLFTKKRSAEAAGYAPFHIEEINFALPLLNDVRELPSRPVWIFGTARGGDLIFDYLSRHKVAIAGFIDLAPASNIFHNLPVAAFADFVQHNEKSTPIILTNRYVKENRERLSKAGFTCLFNAHPLVIQIHNEHLISSLHK